ncbi:MAG TPA: hypothetical protein VGB39_04295, partial [Sphingomicrobium sp.]
MGATLKQFRAKAERAAVDPLWKAGVNFARLVPKGPFSMRSAIFIGLAAFAATAAATAATASGPAEQRTRAALARIAAINPSLG